jgi:hypothetical protein
MPLGHLLTVLLLVCSASAFAQKQSEPFTESKQAAESHSAEVTPSEPWRIIPDQPVDAGSGRNPVDRLRTDEYKVFQFKSNGRTRILSLDADTVASLEGQPVTDSICYSIRSYVVARDDKDSDSTHPVGSSTCQPASRYRVKKALVEAGSSDR